MDERPGERLSRQLRQILTVHEAEKLQRQSSLRRHQKEAQTFIGTTLHPWAEEAVGACRPLGLKVEAELLPAGALLRLQQDTSTWCFAIHVHARVDEVHLSISVAASEEADGGVAGLPGATPLFQVVETLSLFPGPGISAEQLNSVFVAHFSQWLRRLLPL